MDERIGEAPGCAALLASLRQASKRGELREAVKCGGARKEQLLLRNPIQIEHH